MMTQEEFTNRKYFLIFKPVRTKVQIFKCAIYAKSNCYLFIPCFRTSKASENRKFSWMKSHWNAHRVSLFYSSFMWKGLKCWTFLFLVEMSSFTIHNIQHTQQYTDRSRTVEFEDELISSSFQCFHWMFFCFLYAGFHSCWLNFCNRIRKNYQNWSNKPQQCLAEW